MRRMCATRGPQLVTLRVLLLASTLGSIALGSRAHATGGFTVDDSWLAPISLGSKDRQARSLIAQRRWLEAAEQIDAVGPGPRLARGWLFLKAGRAAQALEALADLDQVLPSAARWVRVWRAKAFIELKRPESAIAEAQEIAQGDPSSPVVRRARRYLARGLREAGETAQARRVYDKIIASRRAAEIPAGLLGKARLEVDRGRRKAAVSLLRRIDVEYPTHWAARPARRLAERLLAKRKRLRKRYWARSITERLDRAEMLLKRHRNRDAVTALEPLTGRKLKRRDRCRQRYLLGWGLRKLRRWKQARVRADEAVKICRRAKSTLLPWARYRAGLAAERLGAEAAAARHFRALMNNHPRHRLADDGGFYLVRHYLEDRHDLPGAAAIARKLARRFPRGDMVGEALFFVARDLLQAEQLSEARALLDLIDALPPRDPKPHDAGRVAYWRARIDQMQGHSNRAWPRFRSVIATYPFSWYAILAYSRLREHDPAAASQTTRQALERPDRARPSLPGGDAPEAWRFRLPEGLKLDALERARLLIRLGLTEPANDALREAGVRRDATSDVLWLGAWMYDRAGAYWFSHDILRRQLGSFRRFPPAGAHRRHWALAFPRPLGEIVRREAAAQGVDADLLWAIMREESGFNPRVESWANAMGLMQIIMKTARRMATPADGKINRETLRDPALNIRLGSRYLARISAKTEANTALFPGAYNAGLGAMLGWLRRDGERPLDLFMELIPFREARWYSKRVLASWATYRWMYSQPPPGEPLPYLPQALPTPKKQPKPTPKKQAKP